MAGFEEQRRRRTEPPATHEAAPGPPPHDLLALQRGAGNAALTSWLQRSALARQPVATGPDPVTAVLDELLGRDAVVAPHSGGAAEGLAAALAGAAQEGAEALDWLEQALGFGGPAGGGAQAPAADKAVSDWHTRALATNADYAQWILDGEGLGFVTFTAGMGSKAQMTDLAAGKKVSGVDPGQSAVLAGLSTIHAIVDGRAAHWLADPSQAKAPLMVGSFIRPTGHRGQAIDINGLDWTGRAGPGQVAALLQELPKGSYGIGLPFQGDFFPAELELARRMRAAQAKAGEAGTPDPITDASLQRWVTGTYTATWNAAKTPAPGWDVADAGGSAVSHLRSADLRKAIRDLNGSGYSIYVFPDNDNHIHIQH